MSDQHDLSRRKAIQVLAGTGIPVALAGCSSDGDSTQAITFWSKEPDNEEWIREILSGYDEADVSLQIVPEGDINSEISAARAANNLPNVVQSALVTGQLMNNQDVPANESATQAIQDLGEDDFYDNALELVSTQDGGYFAVPHSIDIQTLGWRQSQFEEVGLSEDPTSWDAIEAAAEAFHDPDNNQFGIGIGSAHHRFTRQCFQPIALSNNARVFNSDGEIIFDDSEMVEAVEFYAQLQREYGIPGDHDHIPVLNAYVDEQIHLLSFSSYILGLITERGGEEMARDTNAAFEHSTGDNSAAAGNATLFTPITSEEENELQVSEDFISFMYEGESYVKWLHDNLGAYGPSRKSVFQSEAYRDHPQWDIWEDDLKQRQQVMDSSLQRFGIIDGVPQPQISSITSQLLIAEAVSRTIDGENAGDVVSEAADKMRDVIE